MGVETALAYVAIVLAGLATAFEVAFFVIQTVFARNTMRTTMKDNSDMVQKVTQSIAKVEGVQEYLQNIYRPTLDALIDQRGPGVTQAVQDELAQSVSPALEQMRQRLDEMEQAVSRGEKATAQLDEVRQVLDHLDHRIVRIGEEAGESALRRLYAREPTPISSRDRREVQRAVVDTLEAMGGSATEDTIADRLRVVEGMRVDLGLIGLVLHALERRGQVREVGPREWKLYQRPLAHEPRND